MKSNVKTIHLIAAARPNFMKIAPLYHALKKESWAEPLIIHTGQHYDINMSDAFFKDLSMPQPYLHLGVGSGTHAEQTGNVMIRYEKAINNGNRPYLVIVVGDVNSTMAVTIAAVKQGVKVAHLEAGLRSFDRTMPEEINRLATDTLADILWTPSPDADENLLREGISPSRIKRVGNIMIDSLEMLRSKVEKMRAYDEFGFDKGKYGIVTIHRPSNVDIPGTLDEICSVVTRISKHLPLIFPIHPRTRNNMDKSGLLNRIKSEPNLRLPEPLNYIKFMSLLFDSRIVITDSGGIQEETSYLGIPCLTLRPNTERPITISHGTNQLCTLENVENKAAAVLVSHNIKKSVPIDLWDGKTAERVVESIKGMVCN